MGSLHAAGGTVVAAATFGIGLIAVVAAVRGGASAWIDRLRVGLTGLIGLQVIAGLVVLGLGSRPAEGLHFLYAVVALGALPLAGTFGSEAPPRPRAWILAAACAVLLVVAWRLASTG